MSFQHPSRAEYAGCGYALLSAAVTIAGFWQLVFGDADVGLWLLATAWLAGRCSTALQAIERLRVRLSDPRRNGGR
ncbi:hypothetical protein [Nonomuraea fuscirosea]|uniref:hypothetical protein n=1 Tax=Nonomuraea fuscirosea TaxID=1291556 RepID=UPI0033C87F31